MVQRASCECPNGLYLCHHMAALLLWMEKNITRTDMECCWGRPKKNPPAQPQSRRSSQMWPSKSSVRISRNVSDEDKAFLKDRLDKLGRFTGMGWILEKEPEKLQGFMTVRSIVESVECRLAVDRVKFVLEAIATTDSDRKRIFQETTQQSAKWLQVREYRVTASNFGRVLKAVKRQSFPPSLFKTLRGQYASTECATAVKWGKTHEKEAVRAYSALHRVVVEAAGMFVDESGMLAATPDGLIGDREIIEVKCPYSARNCTIEDVASKTKNFFLRPSGGSLVLDTEHDYYHQIQGNLHLGNRSLCHLVVWTPLQLAVIGVPYDHSWGKNVETLKLFYQNVYLPHLFGAL